MHEPQHNERISTRFEGVYRRESRNKRFGGKPDVCYSIDYYDPLTGKRTRKTIGWRSKNITAEYASAVRTNLIAQGNKDKLSGAAPLDEKSIPTLAQAWERYKNDWLEARQLKTLPADKCRYALLGEITAKRLHHISQADLEWLTSSLLRQGKAVQTCKHALALVRRVMNKAIVWKMWHGPTPFRDMKLPRVNNERQRYLTPYEAHALLEALQGINRRAWLMSLISLLCGLRFGEIAALRRGDLDFGSGTIFVRDPKGGRDRHAVMPDTVQRELAALPRISSARLLFPTQAGGVMKEVDHVFEAVVNALGFNDGINDRRHKVVFHTLRHTYASWLARSGKSGQSDIAALLGHASLEMSKRYTHLMRDAKKEAAAAVDELFTNAGHQEPRW